MSVQETFLIVKPDGLAKGLVGQILCKIKEYDLTVSHALMIQLTKKMVKKLYAGEEKEVYFNDVVNWVSSAPVLILKIRGFNSISVIKWKIVGRYPNGIRGQYSENWIKNIAHAPASKESTQKELLLINKFIEENERVNQKRLKNKMIFALTGMSECGKSTVGKYFASQGIPRLKFVKLFEKVRDKMSPGEDLHQFIRREEERNPYFLWDNFIKELLNEMKAQKVDVVSIESLYGGGLGPYLKQVLGIHFCIVYIDIPLKIRLQRQMQRENLTTIKQAKEMLLPRDKVKADFGISELKKISEEIIDNSGSLQDLYSAVDKMIIKYQ